MRSAGGGLQKAFDLMKNHIFRFLTQQNLNDLHNEHFPAARFHIISTEEEVRSGGKLGSPYVILLPWYIGDIAEIRRQPCKSTGVPIEAKQKVDPEVLVFVHSQTENFVR